MATNLLRIDKAVNSSVRNGREGSRKGHGTKPAIRLNLVVFPKDCLHKPAFQKQKTRITYLGSLGSAAVWDFLASQPTATAKDWINKSGNVSHD